MEEVHGILSSEQDRKGNGERDYQSETFCYLCEVPVFVSDSPIRDGLDGCTQS